MARLTGWTDAAFVAEAHDWIREQAALLGLGTRSRMPSPGSLRQLEELLAR